MPSGICAVFYATMPLTTALAARAMGMERLSRRTLLAALIALAGVAVLFSSQLVRTVPLLPLFAILAAATCAAWSGVALKRGPRQHPMGANAAGAWVGLVVCLTASWLRHEPHPLPTTPGALGPLIYLTVVGSIGAFGMFAWLIHRWPLTRISFISVIVPVIATALGAWVRHEPITRATLLGSMLVLCGVLIALAKPPGRAALP